MKSFLVLCLSICLVSSFPRAQEEEEAESRANVSLEEADNEGDMMAADRVMALGNYHVCHDKWPNTSSDEGKEAFQDMMSAVNNADERVSGISGDIEKTLSKAVRITWYLVVSNT